MAIKYMNLRLEGEKNALREADVLFKQRCDEYSSIEKTLNDMKYEIPETEKNYNELRRYCVGILLLFNSFRDDRSDDDFDRDCNDFDNHYDCDCDDRVDNDCFHDFCAQFLIDGS